MKENNELTRDDIAIDHDMEVDCDEGREIAVYIETWFDVDRKFHIDTASNDDTWLNMYGRYNPFDDTLRIECEISRQDSSSYFDYEPKKEEAQLIKDMIAEKIREDYNQTPQEFCEEYYGEDQTIGGMLINVQLRSKQEEIQPVRCDVVCIVELSNAEFYDFQFNPLADHDFIKEHLPDLKTDEFHAIPCMLVLGEGIDDGILVDPQGYDYARYTAYIPMARQLFQNEQVESEDEAVEEDSLEEEPFQGMTM